MRIGSLGRATLLALAALLCAPAPSAAAPESLGLRYGFGSTAATEVYRQVDAVLYLPLRYGRPLGTRWTLRTRLELSLGRLGRHRADTMIGSVGPAVSLMSEKLPLAIEVGVSPTLIGRHEFVGRDLGRALQFTSHVGIAVLAGKRLRLGYRFQHISNARLARPNPGLNMHMFSILIPL